jgi:glycosyltransferase involved in cell wall biosynthesis
VVPSRWYEVFPRIVAEAYALGVPVIGSRLGSLEEIIADGETGLHVTAGDPADLARALRALAGDAALAGRLGDGARREYERSLSPAATTDRLLEIYAGTSAGPAADGEPLAAGGAAT